MALHGAAVIVGDGRLEIRGLPGHEGDLAQSVLMVSRDIIADLEDVDSVVVVGGHIEALQY